MAGSAAVVDVVGLKALGKDLAKATDPRAGEVLRYLAQAGRRAAEPVAAQTRGSLPHRTGRLAGDVRVTASRSGAAVRMGRKTVPYAGPVEFGGWPEGRPYIPTGRYLFPAAQSLAATSARLYSEAVGEAFDHFSWTNATDNPEGVHD